MPQNTSKCPQPSLSGFPSQRNLLFRVLENPVTCIPPESVSTPSRLSLKPRRPRTASAPARLRPCTCLLVRFTAPRAFCCAVLPLPRCFRAASAILLRYCRYFCGPVRHEGVGGGRAGARGLGPGVLRGSRRAANVHTHTYMCMCMCVCARTCGRPRVPRGSWGPTADRPRALVLADSGGRRSVTIRAPRSRWGDRPANPPHSSETTR